MLDINHATRHRELMQDWIYSRKNIARIRMSHAQFGALVSSFGGSPVPVTLDRLNGQSIDYPPIDSRLAQTAKEVAEATSSALTEVQEAQKKLDQCLSAKPPKMRDVREASKALGRVIGNLPSNMKFAADSLTEHAEAVVTKAQVDIEGFVNFRARQLGLDSSELGSVDVGALTRGDS